MLGWLPTDIVCRNGTPAARRGRKATGLPAMGDCRVTESASLSRNRHQGACGIAQIRGILAVTDPCGRGHCRGHATLCAAIAVMTEGGESLEQEDWMTPLGNRGRQVPPPFLRIFPPDDPRPLPSSHL